MRLAASLFVLLAAALLGDDRAEAVPSCSYDGAARTLTIALDGNVDVLERGQHSIELAGQPCGATLADVDTVVVNGSAAPDELLLQETFSRFTGVRFELHMDDADQLDVYRGDSNDLITAGSDGVSLNGDDVLDMAMLGSGRPRLLINTAGGSDRISGMGGRGTGGPSVRSMRIDTQVGGDVIHGGNGPDLVVRNYHTGPVADRIYLEGGDDATSLIWVDDGTIISGGEGTDYVGATWRVPVQISLDGVANDGPPDAATNNVQPDVENVTTGLGDDTLIGNRLPNRLIGGGGNDTIKGGWGPDVLGGGQGDDTIDAGNGMRDQVYGSDGTDTATIDCGTDVVDAVESTICAPAAPETPASIAVVFPSPPSGALSSTEPVTVPLDALTRCATPGCDASNCDARWELRTDGGAWTLLPATTPAPILRRTYAIGTGVVYQLRVRTVSCAGIASAPRSSRGFAVDGYDETAATLSAAWTSVDSPAAWGGSLVRAADAGTASLSFTGFGAAWIGQRDPSLRQGRMLLDGTICPARGETTAVVYSRQLIAGCVTESNASRTVTVSPQPGSAVTVDGFVTLRYAAVPAAPRIASRLR